MEQRQGSLLLTFHFTCWMNMRKQREMITVLHPDPWSPGILLPSCMYDCMLRDPSTQSWTLESQDPWCPRKERLCPGGRGNTQPSPHIQPIGIQEAWFVLSQISGSSGLLESWNHRIIELEGAYKAIKSNPLLIAGIQIKGDLTGGCPVFSWLPPALERSPPPKVIGSTAVLL